MKERELVPVGTRKHIWLRIVLILAVVALLSVPFWQKLMRPTVDPRQEPKMTTLELEGITLGVPEHWTNDVEEHEGRTTVTLTADGQNLQFMGNIVVTRAPAEGDSTEDARAALEKQIPQGELLLEEPVWDEASLGGVSMVVAQWTEKAAGSYPAGLVEVVCRGYQGSADGWEYRVILTDMQKDHPLLSSATLEAILQSIEFHG